ncbi:MAG TPA: hypothetical protein VKO35_10160, partial [Acidimicrobiia bacterium]|nr:hypothetical protein [Acidimicrobiia bacterium]
MLVLGGPAGSRRMIGTGDGAVGGATGAAQATACVLVTVAATVIPAAPWSRRRTRRGLMKSAASDQRVEPAMRASRPASV